jgi:hypothetical protein
MTDAIKTAVFSINVDGRDVTSNFDPALISMTIRFTDGGKSNSLEISLDDTDGRIRLPREGADIRATLAWSDGGGAVQFEGKTDEPESEGSRGGGMTLSITAHAADLKGKPKAKKQKHEDDAKFGDVAKEWGQAADLDVKVDDEAVMGASGSARRVALQREAMVLHDPQNPFHIDRRFAVGAQFAVRQGANPAIAISRAFVDNGTDQGKQIRVLGLAIAATRLGRARPPFDQIGAGDASIGRSARTLTVPSRVSAQSGRIPVLFASLAPLAVF